MIKQNISHLAEEKELNTLCGDVSGNRTKDVKYHQAMGGRWPGKVQQLGSATEDKCSVTEGLGERPDHVFIELEAAVKHPCVCIVRWTALTNEIINVLIAAAHRLGKHLWSLQWKDVAAHPRALCEHKTLKWGANVKTVVTCNQITWILMFKAVIVRKHQERFVVWLHDMYLCDRKWLPVLFTGLRDAAAAATNKLLFSIRNGHYQMWERLQVCDYSPTAKQSPGSHIIFNSTETDGDKHTFKWELCTISHEKKNLLCTRTKQRDQTQRLDECYVSQ